MLCEKFGLNWHIGTDLWKVNADILTENRQISETLTASGVQLAIFKNWRRIKKIFFVKVSFSTKILPKSFPNCFELFKQRSLEEVVYSYSFSKESSFVEEVTYPKSEVHVPSNRSSQASSVLIQKQRATFKIWQYLTISNSSLINKNSNNLRYLY